MHFIVIGRDGHDPHALDRRLKVRADHIALGDKMRASGTLLLGVALINENQLMCGSVLLCDFPDRTALDEWLKIEPYVTGDVWREIDVSECRIGPSFLDVFAAAQKSI